MGSLGGGTLGLCLLKERTLQHAQADEKADAREQDAQQKGHAPAPREERRLRQPREEAEDRRRQQQPHRHTRLHPARV